MKITPYQAVLYKVVLVYGVLHNNTVQRFPTKQYCISRFTERVRAQGAAPSFMGLVITLSFGKSDAGFVYFSISVQSHLHFKSVPFHCGIFISNSWFQEVAIVLHSFVSFNCCCSKGLTRWVLKIYHCLVVD